MHKCYNKWFYFYILRRAWRTLLISSILMGWGRGLVLQWLVGLDQCHTIKVTPFLGYRLLEGDVGLLLTKDMAICVGNPVGSLVHAVLMNVFKVSKPADACFAFLWRWCWGPWSSKAYLRTVEFASKRFSTSSGWPCRNCLVVLYKGQRKWE